MSKTSPFWGRALTLCVCARALAAPRLEPTLDYNVRATPQNDLAEFTVHTSHAPHPASCFQCKTQMGCRARALETRTRAAPELDPRGPDHWKQGPEPEPRRAEHWKQVTESARMLETMMQEALRLGDSTP